MTTGQVARGVSILNSWGAMLRLSTALDNYIYTSPDSKGNLNQSSPRFQSSHQCAAAPVQPPSTTLPRNVPLSTEMKYPTFIVITASMLQDKKVSFVRCWKRYSTTPWTYSR